MQIIIDARVLDLYPVITQGFSGGTELYVKKLAEGLSQNHYVDVVTKDAPHPIRAGPRLVYWPTDGAPGWCDVLVLMHNMEALLHYNTKHIILATNGIDPWLGPNGEDADLVDAFPVFSQCHLDMLCERTGIAPAKCYVTGLGVDLADYRHPDPVPGRLLWSNDPARGLWHLLDIFDILRSQGYDVTLHVCYEFERQLERHKWQANALSALVIETADRVRKTPGVTVVSTPERAQFIREELACDIHLMPSDPANRGSQIHGMLQMELAAAGVPLVLAETEALPEVFDGGALMLPVPGKFIPRLGRRYYAEDWADAAAYWLDNSHSRDLAGARALKLAKRNTWKRVIRRWEQMLTAVVCHRDVEQPGDVKARMEDDGKVGEDDGQPSGDEAETDRPVPAQQMPSL